MASRVDRTLARLLSVGLAIGLSSIAWANEIFPAVHDASITVQVRSGLDGKPVPEAHLLAVAGYDEQDLRQQTWHEEALTNAEGKAHFSSRISNLPFLQVWVSNAALCQRKPRSEAFSVDRIRRDGLSTPNQCGFVTSVDEPGIFTVFVRPSRKLLSPKSIPLISGSSAQPEASSPTPAAAPAPVPSSVPSPASAAIGPQATPLTSPVAAAPPNPVAANATDPAKPESQPAKSQPAKDVSAPLPVSAPAAHPAASSASGPVPAPVPVVTPLSQAPAFPTHAAAAPSAQPTPPTVQSASRATVSAQQNSAPPAASAAVTKQPSPISTAILRTARLRRVTVRIGAHGSLARESVRSFEATEADRNSAKPQPTSPAVAKLATPPAPQIPVSLEAAPPPPPSISTDANPQPKSHAFRRHAVAHPAPPSRTKHKAGTAPKVEEKAKLVPASAASGRQE